MKVLIITGGRISVDAAQTVKEFDPDLTIAADRGIENALKTGIRVDRILGDFDSIDPAVLQQVRDLDLPETIFPPEKDYTDTELALQIAMQEAGPKGQIMILGALGTRLDHSMGNVFLLKQPADQGIECGIRDENNEIRLLKGPVQYVIQRDPAWPYISLLPVFGNVENVSLKGFFYPLEGGTLEPGVSLGISNELVDEKGTIQFEAGYLLVFRTRD